jgi:hypothetical protein
VLAFLVSPAGTSPPGPAPPGEVAGDDLEKLDSTVRETGSQWRISPLDIERQGASVIPGVPERPVSPDSRG